MQRIIIIGLFSLLTGCGGGSGFSSGGGDNSNALDITGSILTNRSANCADYVRRYTSSVTDIQRAVSFDGSLVVTVSGDQCSFASNSIPNHDFNDASANFATPVAANTANYQVTSKPAIAASTTALSLQTDNAIFLNGVKLDLLAAGCYGVADGKIGCTNINTPWRYDPMSAHTDFGTDSHNAHTQPDGTYHYHGNPNALFVASTSEASPVVGFAADGFPIYGSYFSDDGTVRAARSSYQLRTGSRVVAGNGTNPGGQYDGRFIDDYVYVAGSGDLDECNGMTLNGQYGYYITDSYPWVMACFKGTPHTSFNK